MANQAHQLPLPLPEVLKPWMTLNNEFHVLICHGNGCQQALGPTTFSRHLYEKHQVNHAIRKQVEEYIQQWQWPYDSQTVPLPPDGSAPQANIEVADGFQCLECVFKTRSRKAGRVHANKEHNKKRAKDEEILKAIRLQSWFGERRERYWAVDESREVRTPSQEEVLLRQNRHERGGSGRGSGSGKDRDKEIKREVEKWSKGAMERRLALNQKPAAVEMDPWLRSVKWHEVLAQSKHDLTATANFVRLPDPDEWQLVRMLTSWERILNRCLDTLEAVDHKDTLKWWVSPKNEVASQRPFELPQNSQTLTKYGRQWQLFLCYVMRTCPEDGWEEESETGAKYTETQWQCVDELRGLLEEREEGVAVARVEGVAVAMGDADEQDPELDTAVMGLIISVVTQDTSRVPQYDSPLMHYLAVCGLDPVAQGYRGSFIYTPILARILWILRLLLLEITLPLKAWPELGLPDRTQVRAVAVAVRHARERHLCEGSYSPASTILTQLAYGKALNKLHRSPSNIHWSIDRQIVYFWGKGVAMEKIWTMWQDVTAELEEILFELVFHQKVPEVPLPLLVDHMGTAQNFRQDNTGFMDHAENQATCKKDWQFLYQQMLRDDPQWHLVQEGSGGGSQQRAWIDIRKSAYLNRERQFLRLLMVAMHIMGGQPARGPELGSIKVVNSIFSARNIFIINGRVVFLTTYDKAMKRRGKIEYVLRFLPLPLSQILVQYLVYVRPFSAVIGKKEWNYLFADEQGPWAGNQLTAALAVATAKHLGVRLTVLAWRQIAIAIANEHVARVNKIWDQDEGVAEDEDDEFAEGEDEAEVELDVLRHILVRQSAHGRRVAERHYAVDGAFMNYLGPDLINAYQQASRAWHMFFEKIEAVAGQAVAEQVKHGREASRQLQPTIVKREKSSQRVAVAAAVAAAEERAVAEDRALEGLRRIYGPAARAHSEGQAAALHLVHGIRKKTATTVIVLPTSSGKSVLFFSLAAMTVGQTVVVVVPFTALVDDLLRRARECGSGSGSGGSSGGSGGGSDGGIECAEWTGEGSVLISVQLLVVSADRAVSSEFLHYVRGLELDGQLAHMFFDDAHVALTDTSYRQRLQELWQLRYLNCPFTCLTATLLIKLERQLRLNLLIEQAVVFRRSTMRRTIRYQVYTSPEAPHKVA